MPSELANALIYPRRNMVIAIPGGVLLEQRLVGLEASVHPEQRLDRTSQRLGQLRVTSCDAVPAERGPGCYAPPVTLTDRKLQLDREVREIVT